MNDKELIARAQAGDERAFTQLYNTHHHRIRRKLSKAGFGLADVDDLTQVVFIRAFRYLPSFRGDAAFFTWLHTICTNTIINFVSDRKRENTVQLFDESDLENIAEPDTSEGTLSCKQMVQVIDNVMSLLPGELAEALVMREVDDLSYEEIAERMQCPVGTVKSRIFRAREELSAQLQEFASYRV